MNLTVRKARDRGHAEHGWLDTWHTFSFADYHDPEHMGFRNLRVINDDVVAPGAGFPMHPHRDMEIFSYILDGTIEHKDTLGNGRQIKPGQVQVMSAGAGVLHSEFNPSAKDPLHLLQIWITPAKRGIKPRYSEWHPKPESEDDSKVLIISGNGRDGSATIEQDADVFRLKLDEGGKVSHRLRPGRGMWLQVMRGSVSVNGATLKPGDGASTEDAGEIEFKSADGTEALLFDLP